MKNIQIIWAIAVLGIIGSLQACREKQFEESEEAMAPSWGIADILKRPAGLGSPEEQSYFEDSFHQLKNGLMQAPDNWELYLKLARLYMLEARISGEHGYYFPAALTVLDRVLHHSVEEGDQFEASFLRASILLSLHRFKEALTYGERALSYNKHHAPTYGTLIDAHVELGNYAQAIDLADKMNALRPDLRSYARVSYLREIHGDVDGAFQAMSMAVKAGLPGQEDVAWCRLTLGDMYVSYGKLAEAKSQYEAALLERPNYPFALAGLARVYSLQKENAKALELLDTACNLIPEVGFFQQKAQIYQEMGDGKAAEQLARTIIDMLEEDEASGHVMNLEFAEVYSDLLNNDSLALHYALKAYKKRPKHIGVNHRLASIYHNLGQHREALHFSQEALKTQTQDPETLGLHGLILYFSGNEEEGWDFIKRSCQKNSLLGEKYAERLQLSIDFS